MSLLWKHIIIIIIVIRHDVQYTRNVMLELTASSSPPPRTSPRPPAAIRAPTFADEYKHKNEG
jgi:hypothetical protein